MKRKENKQARGDGRPASAGPSDRQLDLFASETAPRPGGPPAEAPPASARPAAVREPAVGPSESRNAGSIELQTIDSIETIRTAAARTDPPEASGGAVADAIVRRAQARAPARRGGPALTRRQHDLLAYLQDRERRGARPPSLTEICHDLGLVSRGSLHKQVVALVQAGLVEPMNGKQRGVRLTGTDAANDDAALPLLGVIAAGQPIEALLRDESVLLPAWLRGPGGRYALRVRGDSMRDAGILDGDIVVVEPRQYARNGETVVALIDGEAATLKRIEQRPGEVLLHAENPAFPPQRHAPERVQIQGVVVAALRRYGS